MTDTFRRVKLRGRARADASNETAVMFQLLLFWQKVYVTIVLLPLAWATRLLPTHVRGRALVNVWQFAAVPLFTYPFVVCVRQGATISAALVILAYHWNAAFVEMLASYHRATKKIPFETANRATYFDYVSMRVFDLICLWSLFMWPTRFAGAQSWAWNALLLLSCTYTFALMVIRIDDAYPAHPSSVAAWARIGGTGVAAGTSAVGKLREKLYFFSAVALALNAAADSVWLVTVATTGLLVVVRVVRDCSSRVFSSNDFGCPPVESH